jgi:hypothetical protein
MADQHLLFISKPTGYELVPRDGEPPAVGATLELDGVGQFFVSRISPSPLPSDKRPCAYLQQIPS